MTVAALCLCVELAKIVLELTICVRMVAVALCNQGCAQMDGDQSRAVQAPAYPPAPVGTSASISNAACRHSSYDVQAACRLSVGALVLVNPPVHLVTPVKVAAAVQRASILSAQMVPLPFIVV